MHKKSLMNHKGSFCLLRRSIASAAMWHRRFPDRRQKDFSKKSANNTNLARNMHLSWQPLIARAASGGESTGGLKASHFYL